MSPPSRRRPVAPGQVWLVDVDPVRGPEQSKGRPALVVSSRLHLGITLGQLVSVLPLTSVERRGWMHRIHTAAGGGWVITERVRTVCITRFRRYAPQITLSRDELDEVQHMLAQLLTVSH